MADIENKENTSDADQVSQLEEIEALKAIYGCDFVSPSLQKCLFEIRIHLDENSWWSATIQFRLPSTYPSRHPPHFTIFSECLSTKDIEILSELLSEQWEENIGQSVVYIWVETVRTKLEEIYSTKQVSGDVLVELPREASDVDVTSADKQGTTRNGDDYLSKEDFLTDTATGSENTLNEIHVAGIKAVSLPGSDESAHHLGFVSGEPVTDRKSTFQAHVAHVVSEEHIKLVMTQLKKNRKIANATHNILAYRIEGKTPNTFLQDCDDDGETNAGSRLLHLLQILDAKNVMVVVSRWYGGILLGPDRFKHINNCARTLLTEVGFGHRIDEKAGKGNREKKTTKHLSKMKKR